MDQASTYAERRLRILDVSPKVVLPPESGSRVRIFNLLLHLSANHDVRLFSQARLRNHTDASSTVWLTESFSELRYTNPIAGTIASLAETRLIGSPAFRGAGIRFTRPRSLQQLLGWADVVLVEFPWQLSYCRQRARDKPIVFASHNVEALRFSGRRGAVARGVRREWSIRRIERAERRAVACADLILAVSEDDRAQFVSDYGADPDDVVVIPNGADTMRYKPADAAQRRAARERLGLPDRPTVMFIGANTEPNRAGLDWVRRLSESTDRFTFLVVGEISKGELRTKFVAPGVVNDPAPYFAASDISICPIEFGGGTKIKLLESLAAGLPTVAFAESTRGLDLVPGEHVLVVDKSEEELLAALDRLASDGRLAERLGAAGRERMVRDYDWRAIGTKLESTLRHLVATCPRTRRRAHASLGAAERAQTISR